jgi:hypothetical protein
MLQGHVDVLVMNAGRDAVPDPAGRPGSIRQRLPACQREISVVMALGPLKARNNTVC